MIFKNFKTIAATALIAGASVFFNASSGAATVIGLYNDVGGTLRANITCDACSALLFTQDGTDAGGQGGLNNVVLGTAMASYGFGDSFGEIFPAVNGIAAEIAWVNIAVGASYVEADTNKNEMVGDGITYTSSAAYVLMKTGQSPNVTILRNNNIGGSFDFSWDGFKGSGLSHYTEFGDVAAVPIPAAGFLLIGALGGLAGLRRRRKAA